MPIYYQSGYKYQLKRRYESDTGIRPLDPVSDHEFISLDSAGHLVVQEGYAWDGPSGPTIDTKNFMRGSLEHDALYQLIREGYLPLAQREEADKRLRVVCLEDGMWALRAWWVYQGVRIWGKEAAKPRPPVIEEAP